MVQSRRLVSGEFFAHDSQKTINERIGAMVAGKHRVTVEHYLRLEGPEGDAAASIVVGGDRIDDADAEPLLDERADRCAEGRLQREMTPHAGIPEDAIDACPRARGIGKRFGAHQALHGIDLDVEAGSVVVLIGPSGSGKSTLIRCINGLVRPDEGALQIAGNPVDIHYESAWQRMRTEVGMVFQDYSLFPHLTVLRNMTITPERRHGVPRAKAEEEARMLLARVGLAHKAQDYPSALSGGSSSASRSCARSPCGRIRPDVSGAMMIMASLGPPWPRLTNRRCGPRRPVASRVLAR